LIRARGTLKAVAPRFSINPPKSISGRPGRPVPKSGRPDLGFTASWGGEEWFMLNDRPADGASKLIVDKSRLRVADRVEVIARVPKRVARIFECRTVEVVGAGLRDDVDDTAAAASILRRKLRQKIEFLNRIDREK